MGDRLQRVHRVQLAAGFVRVVHAVDAQAQLEAQLRFVAKPPGDLRQQLAADVQGQFVAVDHDFLDGVVEFDVIVGLQRLGQPVDDARRSIRRRAAGCRPASVTSRTSRP